MKVSRVTMQKLASEPVAPTPAPIDASGVLTRASDTIAATYDEAERTAAIWALAKLNTLDAVYELILHYERCMWRETKLQIIQALATTEETVSHLFLFSLIQTASDIGLATEAVSALAATGRVAVGTFLLSIASNVQSPLCREAISALGSMPFFPCDAKLVALAESARNGDISEDIGERAFLALAKRGSRHGWEHMARIIARPETPEPLLAKCLMSAGLLPARFVLDDLSKIVLRTGSWLDDLKNMVMTTLLLQSHQSIEEAIEALLAAQSDAQRQTCLFRLCTYSPADVRIALSLMHGQVPFDSECLLRSKVAATAHVGEDRAFVSAYHRTLSTNAIGCMHLAYREIGEEFLPSLTSRNLSDGVRVRVYGDMHVPGSLDHLERMARDLHQPFVLRRYALAGLTQQAFLAPVQQADEQRRRCAVALEHVFVRESDPRVQEAVVDGFGWLHWAPDYILRRFTSILEHGDNIPLKKAIFFALGRINTDDALMCLREWAPVTLGEHDSWQYSAWLTALASRNQEGAYPEIDTILWPQTDGARVALLKILSTTRSLAHQPFIADCLRHTAYRTKVLAITAAKFNFCHAVKRPLFELLGHSNASVAERAVDTLCIGGDVEAHCKLIDLMRDMALPQAFKILRSIKIKADTDYRPVWTRLNDNIRRPQGTWRQREVLAAAVTLRDVLDASFHKEKMRELPSNKPEQHVADVENILTRHILAYPHLSETIKSVLINAELTYQNPELFSQRVDKSTVIIEYVKSIDIFMQETAGKQLLSGNSQVLSAMQSLVAQLRVDDETIPLVQRIRELNCGSHFSPDEFPAYKMTVLAQAIASGKIVHDPYRYVDGVRAWSLVLLLYGREFWFHRVLIRPILNVRHADNETICEVVLRMNALQEWRNMAAHRGTMLESAELSRLRQRCIDIINVLGLVFGASPQERRDG